MSDKITDLNVLFNVPLPAPALLMHEMPRSAEQAAVVQGSRERIEAILHGESDRFIVIVGPCSIHDPAQGIEYAKKLVELNEKVKDRLELVMRVYFEKPRTSVGWKGLIMDPDLDGTANLAEGLRIARNLLGDILDLGVPTSTEFLDPITPQYIADLICWAAIGARTVESQTHRQMASGLSMPVGFKNTTYGGMSAVVNALKAAIAPQTFFGISAEGVASMVSTKGNANCHTVLRGGDDGPNFDAESVSSAIQSLEKGGVSQAVVVDASHANCSKDFTKMPSVFEEIVAQRAAGNRQLVGAMLESNLVEGNQKILADHSEMTWGQSVTDPCISWETTEEIILKAAETLR
ncbi:3-deoxy-7-phosphoheptulonate synthase [Verrucomicrobiales bacterium BCK34]|nr:3-deoxy-7-phosphoheptulonate synthase [Verrucomicrobiales bacterium BCK34]